LASSVSGERNLRAPHLVVEEDMTRSHLRWITGVFLVACSAGPSSGDSGPATTSSTDGSSSGEDTSSAATTAAESTQESGTDTGIDTTCPALQARAQTLGDRGFSGVLGVMRGGEPLLEWSGGSCIVESDTPCATSSVFDIGSITKQFTGAAIVALEEDGLLSVDDTLAQHLVDVPPDKAAITIHQLLTHTAGFPDALGDDYEAVDRLQYLERAMAEPLLHAPGSQHRYSNVGYSILAAIIELRPGDSYEHWLAERLLEPAGMTHTGYVLPSFDDVVVAHGYGDGQSMGAPNEQNWADDGPYWNLRGNGGVLSTLDDLRAWHEALLGDAILSEASKEKMFTPWVDEGFGDSFYGYGWVIIDVPGVGTVITHNGGNGFFFADIIRIPEADLLVVLLNNAWNLAWEDTAAELATIALTECP
jgi:CubicO group peptidase (beta-lactamase class C family)